MDVDNNNTRNITKRKTPDDGLINGEVKKAKHYQLTLQIVVSRKKTDEITFENISKKNIKTRRKFLCSNVPTIVVTPIKSKKFTSATSVIKFLGLRNKNALSKKVLAHIFSGNFRTLFIHFEVDVNEQQLMQLAQNFNNIKNRQMEQKENNDRKQRIVMQKIT
ncbi:hypothetical protein RFI_26244 [Reticulomyxa filosa]|uniref:Uncharacterized protein n=1 Tax=Reticulomyxa filosa TaxID=46433 RepID=X6MCF8_RETFI|nr:hypothetical protein RFI_26244 [Reticulomyxa filosa]|eukprot:ETO11132.1 hypothetical protein RFI_26244 [Reticulomyxa filosa]